MWASCRPTMRGTIKSYIRRRERSQRVHCEQMKATIVDLVGRTRHFDDLSMQLWPVLTRITSNISRGGSTVLAGADQESIRDRDPPPEELPCFGTFRFRLSHTPSPKT
ncbi:hypothetical protein NDU88_003620 [Pleurodeles waltl]|uniref:Uncharacterized protein n=1 Tax=Pleurodeles waltl TaxID=8319 RepID=A0AAV7PDC8_PLEWA|nr:hypothetical protein NDU88_003620 [Pleurodeles waltl]